MLMELHQIRYFVAVSRLLNFTRAAEHSEVSQPALTKAIQKLEFAMGGELVHRERQRTQLTELGKLILPMMENIVAQVDQAKAVSREYQRKDNAPLKIGLTSCVSANLLVSSLAEVSRFVPGLRIDLIEEPQHRLVEMIYQGEINAALTGAADPLPERIDQWVLFDERLLVLAAPDHRLAEFDSIPAARLAEAAWLEKQGCSMVSMFERLGVSADQIRIAHRGRHEGQLQYLVEAGLGVMLVAEHAPRLPSLVARPIEGNALRQTIRLIVIAGRQYSPAQGAFIKILRGRDWSAYRPDGAPQPIRAKPPARTIELAHLDRNSGSDSGYAAAATKLKQARLSPQ
jgi:DNA-binding transcriptional LysR family regulator